MARKLRIPFELMDEPTKSSVKIIYSQLIDAELEINYEYRKFLEKEYRRLAQKALSEDSDSETNFQKSMMLSNFLDYIVGSKEQFHIRQIKCTGNKFASCFGLRVVFTGSRQEALKLNSDIDVMLELPVSAQFHKSDGSSAVFIRTDCTKPGFAILECLSFQKIEFLSPLAEAFKKIRVLSNTDDMFSSLPPLFLAKQLEGMLVKKEEGKQIIPSESLSNFLMYLIKGLGIPYSGEALKPHGPCVSGHTGKMEFDLTCGIYCADRHPALDDWGKRIRRFGWPSDNIVERALRRGFHLIPIGDKTSTKFPIEWRFSFCVTEIELVESFNHTQMQCYALLKIFLKEKIESISEFEDILSSYFMKNLMFWAIEESDQGEWVPENLVDRFRFCLSKYLLPWVKEGTFPNYFIPGRKMLAGRVDENKRESLWNFLNRLYCNNEELSWLNPSLTTIYKPNRIPHHLRLRVTLSSPKAPAIFLEREWEQIQDYTYYMDVLGSSELPLFFLTSDVCKNFPPSKEKLLKLSQVEESESVPDHVFYQYMSIAIHEWHKEVFLNQRENKAEDLLMIEEVLDGLKTTDLSSFRLSLATFYYVNGEYDKALQLSEEVDKGITSYVVHLGSAGIIEMDFPRAYTRDFSYLEEICGHGFSMEEKISKALALDFVVPPGSQLIPKELQLMASKETTHPLRFLQFAPILYAQFLSFLCYHHKCLFDERDMMLAFMHDTIENREYVDFEHIAYVQLGICFEMQGKYPKAIEHYSSALDVIKRDKCWYYQKPVELYLEGAVANLTRKKKLSRGQRRTVLSDK